MRSYICVAFVRIHRYVHVGSFRFYNIAWRSFVSVHMYIYMFIGKNAPEGPMCTTKAPIALSTGAMWAKASGVPVDCFGLHGVVVGRVS